MAGSHKKQLVLDDIVDLTHESDPDPESDPEVSLDDIVPDLVTDDDTDVDEDAEEFFEESPDLFDVLSGLMVTRDGETIADVLASISDSLDKNNKIMYKLLKLLESRD